MTINNDYVRFNNSIMRSFDGAVIDGFTLSYTVKRNNAKRGGAVYALSATAPDNLSIITLALQDTSRTLRDRTGLPYTFTRYTLRKEFGVALTVLTRHIAYTMHTRP